MIFSLPFAALITALLFVGMSQLISKNGSVEVGSKTAPIPSILAQIPESEVRGPDDERITPPDSPPPVVDRSTRKTDRTPDPIPDIFNRVDPNPGGLGGSGEIMAPVIQMRPAYPENCRSRNAEGRVTVSFVVTPRGEVTNVRVTETADRCFNKTVVKTVRGWKYPPVSDGQRRVESYTFYFELT